MSVSGINAYNSSMNAVSAYMENSISTKSTSAESLFSSNSSTSSSYGVTGRNTDSQRALQRAIAELNELGAVGISEGTITTYKQALEKEFSGTLKEELVKVGVPSDVKFNLVADSNGAITVQCDDAEAKAKIEEYLKANEEVEEQFRYIQALGNLDRATKNSLAQSQLKQIKTMKATIQAQALDAFFSGMFESGSGNGYSSMLADFSGSDASYFMGANYTV